MGDNKDLEDMPLSNMDLSCLIASLADVYCLGQKVMQRGRCQRPPRSSSHDVYAHFMSCCVVIRLDEGMTSYGPVLLSSVYNEGVVLFLIRCAYCYVSMSTDMSLPLARLDKMPWRGVFSSFLDLETIHP